MQFQVPNVLRRNFIAIKEGFENTWLNPIAQLVRHYSHDGVSLLTPEEAAAIPGPRRWLTGFYFTMVTVGVRIFWHGLQG